MSHNFSLCLILLGALNQNVPYLKFFLQELIHSLATAGPVMAKSELQPCLITLCQIRKNKKPIKNYE